MRILVDTPVWVDFFNGHPSPEAEALDGFIRYEHDIATCGVIVAEFFQGIRNRESLPELESQFRDMSYLRPDEPWSYFRAAALFRDLRGRGITVRSTIDCLIARLAAENDAYLLAKDHDLERIVVSGLCPVRPAPGL